MTELAAKLVKNGTLSESEFASLLESYTEDDVKYLAEKAENVRKSVYGNSVFIRGLIEISNYCKNDCLYCGIRRSNKNCNRYRMTKDDILECCKEGYGLGFRTFVLQGGEDGIFTDDFLCNVIASIKTAYPDTAVTLSVGERSKESYQKLFDAGADRYLLRHETADKVHYTKLHPKELSLKSRMECIKNLRNIGFQVGVGFMVGSPFQTAETLAKDLCFIQEFQPDMCGIGPFIPHRDTPFKHCPAGSVDLTCFLLSVIRIICPTVLLPATTALGTLSNNGREKGILSGANVVMPNLSPKTARKKYELYNNKLSDGEESGEGLTKLKQKLALMGFQIPVDRGDVKKG